MAGNFSAQLGAFAEKTKRNLRTVFVNSASATKYSWTDGSQVTGSPGVPVVTGNLKGSIQLTFPSDGVAKIIATGIAPDGSEVGYARIIEFNLRGAKIPAGPPHGSTVGGPHARALTIAGFSRLVDAEVAKVAGNG